MTAAWVNSADSHVLEPDDLWATRLPTELRERGPRRERADGREIIYIDGKVIRRDPLDFAEAYRPPGAMDPHVRLKDLDGERIWAELIFPSRGLWLPLIEDPALENACNVAYNDWLFEDIAPVSPRFIGVAALPMRDVDNAVRELQRAAALGAQAMFLAPTPPGQREFNSPEWDPLWAAAADAGTPLCFHVGSGEDPKINKGPGGLLINYVETFYPVQRTVSQLVASGALDRNPELHVVMVEGGASWLPSLMERMDEAARQHGRWVKPKLELLPSEYIVRQVHATFQHDRAVLPSVDITGLDALLWGSDYPHLEGTFGHTQEFLDEMFAGSAPDVRAAITGGNLGKLFDLPATPAK